MADGAYGISTGTRVYWAILGMGNIITLGRSG